MKPCGALAVAVALFVLPVSLSASEPFVPGFQRLPAHESSEEGGRLLYNELGCANCHGGETGLPQRRGPQLAGLTQRARVEWLMQFLANPSDSRSGSAMPRMAGLSAEADREAVVQYLATVKPAAATPTANAIAKNTGEQAKAAPKALNLKHVNAARGKQLFHTVGCAACHAPSQDYEPPDGMPKAAEFTYGSVVFPQLAQKFVLSSLIEFLRAPLKVRPDGRMPHILLEDEEAVDIAGYLFGYGESDGTNAEKLPKFVPDPALVERGRNIVAAQRCAACHALPVEVAKPAVVEIRQTTGGCMAEHPKDEVPHFDLGASQRKALARYLARRDGATGEFSTATLSLYALNCVACHERDGAGGPDAARKAYFLGDHNLGDTGRYVPPLTGVGRKLQPEWMEKVLNGGNRVRPYLQTRMPVYGASTESLVPALAKADAKSVSPLRGGEDTAGRTLLGTQGGLGCITCHRWGQHASLGIQGLDLSNIGQRLQPEWLMEYLVNPAAYRPGTLMPSFWPSGKAANTTVLDGDTARQVASIYSFAKSANGEPEGFPASAGGEFMLVPKDRPIVQRTFMKGVGTHAILVGFPTGAHFAYDGQNARPVLAWRGEFFDAYNTWFSRFAPFEKAPSEANVAWPEAAPLSGHGKFLGYRTDKQGVPSFSSEVNGMRVEDRIEGIEGGLLRTIQWTALREGAVIPSVTHPAGVSVTEMTVKQPNQRSFSYTWK